MIITMSTKDALCESLTPNAMTPPTQVKEKYQLTLQQVPLIGEITYDLETDNRLDKEYFKLIEEQSIHTGIFRLPQNVLCPQPIPLCRPCPLCGKTENSVVNILKSNGAVKPLPKRVFRTYQCGAQGSCV